MFHVDLGNSHAHGPVFAFNQLPIMTVIYVILFCKKIVRSKITTVTITTRQEDKEDLTAFIMHVYQAH